MRSIVVYYSYSGNTHKVAQGLVGALKSRGEEVTPVRIRPLKEDRNLVIQILNTILGKKPELYRTLLDLSGFDRIIVGCPVWAFTPTPAINTYLDKCASLGGKKAVAFVTHKIGLGSKQTLSAMKKRLELKGAKSVKTISFQQNHPAEKYKNEFLKLLTSSC